jgi:hypothetical protein
MTITGAKMPHKREIFETQKKALPLGRNYEIIFVHPLSFWTQARTKASMNAFTFLRQPPPCQPLKSGEESSFIAIATPATEVRDA